MITPEAAAADVRRVAALLGEPDALPTWHSYREHGCFDVNAVQRRFGSRWTDVGIALGLRLRSVPKGTVTRERVLADYRRAARAEGGAVSRATFARYVPYSPQTAARRHFGTWSALVRAAGYDPADVPLHPAERPIRPGHPLYARVQALLREQPHNSLPMPEEAA